MANETTTRSDRTRQEQIRKRRHNLFKRIKEFNDRYQIETWLVMRMPSGWIYTFNTNDEKAPTEEELAESKKPVVRKCPEDYESKEDYSIRVRSPPPFTFQRPTYKKSQKLDSIENLIERFD
ncbi:unnamed protein product [Penicillium pancosmium]